MLLVPRNLFPTGNCWGLSEHQQQNTLPGGRLLKKSCSHNLGFRVATLYCYCMTVELTRTGEATARASAVVVWTKCIVVVVQNVF